MILPIYFTNQNRLDSDTEIVSLLTKILNSSYTSGIDKLLSYGKTANGNIVGEFDGDGTRFQYFINTTANTISYEAVQSRKDGLPARFDAARKVKVGAQTAANKSGKKLTCTPGKNLSLRCRLSSDGEALQATDVTRGAKNSWAGCG